MNDFFAILTDYSFITVALGTVLLATATSMIGTVSVLTKQSLIGDTLGHASYPGVIFAFMVFQSREPILLMLGAMVSGYISYTLIYWLTKTGKHSLTNALALVSSSFFGLGMVLKNFIQGHKAYSKAAQAGLQQYLFGQAAFIQIEDVLLISVVSISCIVLFLLFYQSYKVYLFDESFAAINGVQTKLLHHLTILMMIALISVGLKVVGAILMSSFLVAPAVCGLLAGRHYGQTLILATLNGVISAFLGAYISSIFSGLSTGPAIIIIMTIITLATFTIKKLQLNKGGA